jgi:hypothetical protein
MSSTNRLRPIVISTQLSDVKPRPWKNWGKNQNRDSDNGSVVDAYVRLLDFVLDMVLTTVSSEQGVVSLGQ